MPELPVDQKRWPLIRPREQKVPCVCVTVSDGQGPRIESAFALSPGGRERPRRVIMSSAEILENDCLGIVCGLVKRSDAPHERRAVQRGGDVAVEVRFTRAVAARRSGNVGRFHHKSERHARGRVGSVPCDEKGERRNGGVDLLVDTDVHDGAGLQGSGTAQPVRKRSRGKRGIAQAGPWGDSRDSGGCLTDGA